MAVHNLRSRRNTPLPDVYVYDELSSEFRGQFLYMLTAVWTDYIGRESIGYAKHFYPVIGHELRREYGLATLAGWDQYSRDVADFLLKEKNVERVLDLIELATRTAVVTANKNKQNTKAQAFVDELNQRLRIAGLGYEFIGDELIRIDSTVLHQSAVKPALQLLGDPDYALADQEFRDAHKHYRAGDYDDCLVGCGRAFESVLKVICHKKGWQHKATDTAKTLIQVVVANGLLPSSSQAQLDNLRCLLETTVPTPRNKLGGHGKGVVGTPAADQRIAEYLWHQTAATILLLVQCA